MVQSIPSIQANSQYIWKAQTYILVYSAAFDKMCWSKPIADIAGSTNARRQDLKSNVYFMMQSRILLFLVSYLLKEREAAKKTRR